ncbi:unnamed protein product [Alopecurus aequalis]
MDVAVFDWNIRGMNSPTRRRAVFDVFSDSKCSIACFQETKMEVISRSLVVEMLGSRFADNFLFKPAAGTRGGILLAVSDDFAVQLVAAAPCQFSLSATVTDRRNGDAWDISVVYGPQEDQDKIVFIQELKDLQSHMQPKWLLLGDFNLIQHAADKSNANLNLRMMGRFRAAIRDLELSEFPLVGRKYTWTSDSAAGIMSRIDRVFMTCDWELAFPQLRLAPASSAVSDHCPLLLKKMDLQLFRGFRFESYWTKLPDFLAVVEGAWAKHVHSADAFRRLHTKLARVAKALKKWNRQRKKEQRVQTELATEIIFNLDLAQENRDLLRMSWS